TWQHVLYNADADTLSNASSCTTGVAGNPGILMNVHSTLLSYVLPATIKLVNADTVRRGIGLQTYDAVTAAPILSYYYPPAPDGDNPLGKSAITLTIAALEKNLHLTPPTTYDYNIMMVNTSPPYAYLQYMVTSALQGSVFDLTTQCDVYGYPSQTIPAQLTT